MFSVMCVCLFTQRPSRGPHHRGPFLSPCTGPQPHPVQDPCPPNRALALVRLGMFKFVQVGHPLPGHVQTWSVCSLYCQKGGRLELDCKALLFHKISVFLHWSCVIMIYDLSNFLIAIRPTHRKAILLSFYRPQRSWGKVMFLQASVILFTGGGVPDTPWTRYTPHPWE